MRTTQDTVCTGCGRILAAGRAKCPVDGSTTIRRPRLRAGQTLHDRYRLEEVLGAGAWATVFRARDLAAGEDVAVKVLLPSRRAETASVEQFFREARVLGQVNHPRVVTVRDSGQAGDTLYFVMEWVAGRSLAEEIARDAPFAAPKAVRIARQIAEGLSAAHTRGVIHRDLKPANVLLARAGDQLRAKVGDFGIARSLIEEDARARGGMAGTPSYMSPEQARSEPADARSDLYSLGLVLYEMLAGDLPIPREPALRTLQARLQPLPPISRAVPAIELPVGLEDVLMSLVALLPEERPASAAEVVDRLDRFDSTAVTGQPWTPQPMPAASSRAADADALPELHTFAPLLLAPPLCGRAAQLAKLLPAVERLDGAPEATLLVLTGPRGIGKTALARHLLQQAGARGARCLDAECGDGSTPLFEVARALEDLLGTRHIPTEDLGGRLGEILAREGVGDERTPAELLAVLRPMPRESGSLHDAETQQTYAIHVALDALAQLAARRPIALLLDDAQYADPWTHALVGRIPLWARDKGRGLLVIVTWTTGEGMDEPPAGIDHERFAERAVRADLAPLDPDETDALLRAVGPLDAEARRFLAKLTEGHPLFTLKMVRHFRDEGLLIPTRHGWRLSPRSRLDLSVPASVEELGRFELEALRRRDEPGLAAADLLERLALCGEHVPAPLLGDALLRSGRADLADRLAALLDLLEAQGVVRRDGFAVAFRHSLVQRAIAAGFAATADARRLHLAIAEALLATPDGASPKRGRDVAVHLIHAGEPDRALPLVLASAAHRESLGETPRAFDEYGMALRILTDVPDAPRTARLDVHVGVGRTALAMGRGRVAAEHYLKALEIEETGDAHLGLGRAAEASGDYAVALDHLDRARSMFEAAGRPTGAAEALFWVGRIHERQGDFAASRTARQESIVRFEAAGDAVGAAIAQLDLGHMEAAYLRDFTAGLALLAQATHVAEEAGDPALLARCHQSTASAQTEAEMYEEAVEGYRKANLHWVRAGAMPRLAACLLGWGTTLAYQERADEGHVLLEAALRLREDMGDPHGVAACRVNLAMACRVAGHFEEAVEWARGAVAMALPLQSATIAAYGRSELGLALIRLGSLDEAESLLTAVLADPWAARAIGGDCLDGLGQIALARGSLVDARRLWAEAADAWAAAGWPRFAAAVRAKLVTHGSPGDTSGS